MIVGEKRAILKLIERTAFEWDLFSDEDFEKMISMCVEAINRETADERIEIKVRDDSVFLSSGELNEAKNVLRINEDGIMLSESGIEGPYRYLRLEGIDIEGVTKSFSGRLSDV